MSNGNFSATLAAEAAERAARAAENASEERLEGSGYNPFVILDIRELEDVVVGNPNAGFFAKLFGPTKQKLSETVQKVSVKRTDISFLEGAVDDFGTPYTIVNLEDRCELDYMSVEIPGTLEQNLTILNKNK